MAIASIVYQARLHWIIFVWPVLLFIFASYLSISYPLIRVPSLLCCGVALLWCGLQWLSYRFSCLMVYPKKLVIQTGIWVRQIEDLPLNNIESLHMRQPILGTFFYYGSLIIKGTGGSSRVIHYLEKPLTCRRYIEQQMEGLKHG
jgi:uncharacterized membrane protein YdbT with pleckstrin-like domain